MDEKEILLLHVVQRISDLGKLCKESLSCVLLFLDEKGITLTQVILTKEGYVTPDVKRKFNEYFVYEFIEHNGNMFRVTGKGAEEISKKVASLQDNTKIVTIDALLDKYKSKVLKHF